MPGDLAESDARPLLNPVDRKLQWSVGFDVPDRYKRLYEKSKRLGFDAEAAWIGKLRP